MNFKKKERKQKRPEIYTFLSPLKISGKSVQSSLRNPAEKKGGGGVRKKILQSLLGVPLEMEDLN